MRTARCILTGMVAGTLALACSQPPANTVSGGPSGENGGETPPHTVAQPPPQSPPPSADCSSSSDTQLGVDLQPQANGAWCWAASGQMVLASLNPSVSVAQCDQANQYFQRSDCCGDSTHATPEGCNREGWPVFEPYGYVPAVKKNSELSWQEIKTQIACRRQPFAFSWQWDDGSGHMMVATGFQTTPEGIRMVCWNDPLPMGTGEAYCDTYEEYVSGDDHTHWNDYYNFRRSDR